MASSDDGLIAGIRDMNLAHKKLLRINPKQKPWFVIKHLARVFGSNDETIAGENGQGTDDDDSIIGRIKTVFEIFHTLKRFDAEEASDVLIGNLDGILSQVQALHTVQSELRIESVKTVENESIPSPNWNIITIPSTTTSYQNESESEDMSVDDDSPPILNPEVEINNDNVQLNMNPVVQLIPPGLRLKCTVCKSKCFSSPEILDLHIQAHTTVDHNEVETMQKPIKKIHICPVCGKKCRVPSTLKEHIRTHTKFKPFICPVCSSRFTQKGSCKHHILHQHDSTLDPLVEEDEETLESQGLSLLKMDKSSTDTSLQKVRRARRIKSGHVNNLKKNMKQKRPLISYSKLTASIKNTKKKFQTLPPSRQQQECTYCRRKFQGVTNLRVHLRIHTGEKPFSCKYCQKRFNQSGACKLHTERHERPYPCEFCTRSFFTSSLWNSHLKSRHSDIGLSKDKQTNQTS